MVERFQKYLDKKFHVYPKSKALADLKEELLGNLMDRYNEYVAEGLSQEDAYNKAVASVGDTGDAARLADSSAGLKVKALRAGLGLSITALYWVVVVTAFLGVSLITNAWSWTWLIIAGGAFIYMAVILGVLHAKERSLNRKKNTRAIALIASMIITLVLYLVLSFAIEGAWAWSWLICLAGVFGWFTYDSIAYSRAKSPASYKIRAYFLIAMWTVAIYLTVSIAVGTIWAYSWMIIMVGVIGILMYNLSVMLAQYNKETKK
jgi:MFS family permease